MKKENSNLTVILDLYEHQLKDEIEGAFPLLYVNETYQNLVEVYKIVRDMDQPVMKRLAEHKTLYDNYVQMVKE